MVSLAIPCVLSEIPPADLIVMSFDWQVAIGDQLISPEEFKKMMKNASRLIKFKENYIYVGLAEK